VLPPAPSCSFGSDNHAGAHPDVLAALTAAAARHVPAYGDDPFTAAAVNAFGELFAAPVPVLFTWGGTGANVVGLQTMLQPHHAVICPSTAHINVDECGAPERFTGCKLITVECPDGKLTPDHVTAQLGVLGDVHHVQPRVVSITQSTEYGTLYSVDEIAALTDCAHANGLLVHLDGARIANAAAALGGDIRAFTIDAGVDVLTFGGTKNGMVYGEAVVFLNQTLATNAGFFRKQAGQLPSKMRFVSAQFSALLANDLWLTNAGHANAMASRLAGAVSGVDGLTITQPTTVNAVFASLPPSVIERLQQWATFYTWNEARHEVRWMCAFDTTADDVDRFAAGIIAAMADR
jgi:threonine aldolase